MAAPTDVPGLINRWRADSIAQANATAVSTWPALTGGASLTQSTAASQPTYITSSIGAKPAVRFNGTSSTMTASLTATAQPFTVSTVLNLASVAALAEILYFGSEMVITPGQWDGYAGVDLVGGTPATATNYIFTYVANGATSKVFINGTSVGSGNTGTNGIGVTMYAGSNGTARFASMDLAEVNVYSHALTTSELATLDTYYYQQYGISSPDATTTVTATATVTAAGSGAATTSGTDSTSSTVSGKGAGTAAIVVLNAAAVVASGSSGATATSLHTDVATVTSAGTGTAALSGLSTKTAALSSVGLGAAAAAPVGSSTLTAYSVASATVNPSSVPVFAGPESFILQQAKSISAMSTTSSAATFTSPVTPGSTQILLVTTSSAATGLAVSSGWTQRSMNSSQSVHTYVFDKVTASTNDTTAYSSYAPGQCGMFLLEVSGLTSFSSAASGAGAGPISTVPFPSITASTGSSFLVGFASYNESAIFNSLASPLTFQAEQQGSSFHSGYGTGWVSAQGSYSSSLTLSGSVTGYESAFVLYQTAASVWAWTGTAWKRVTPMKWTGTAWAPTVLTPY